MIANSAVAGGGIGALFLFLLVAGAYLLPTIIAYVRKVTNVGSVFVINFFLGWTFVGWIVALAMSVKTKLPTGLSSQVTVVTGSNVQLKDQEAATIPGMTSSVKLETSSSRANEECVRCNQVLPTGANFCIKCGERATLGEQAPVTSEVSGNESTKWCDNCSKELDPNVKFCSQCGTEAATVNPYLCLECNGPITLDDKFCPTCGTKID